jgi:hypothetical protein
MSSWVVREVMLGGQSGKWSSHVVVCQVVSMSRTVCDSCSSRWANTCGDEDGLRSIGKASRKAEELSEHRRAARARSILRDIAMVRFVPLMRNFTCSNMFADDRAAHATLFAQEASKPEMIDQVGQKAPRLFGGPGCRSCSSVSCSGPYTRSRTGSLRH